MGILQGVGDDYHHNGTCTSVPRGTEHVRRAASTQEGVLQMS